MTRRPLLVDRRLMLLRTGATGIAGLLSGASACGSAAPATGRVVRVTEFGAREGQGVDNTRAIQAAVDAVQLSGGGTVLVPGRFHCGNILISGRGVIVQGQDGWLIDGRLTIASGAEDVEVRDLGLLETRGDAESFLLDVAGRNCRLTNVSLVKDPKAGGYQMYMRQSSAHCHFTGLRFKGSNGVMVAGHDHLFERFELESTLSRGVGGDDAFAIKGLNEPTYNITIRDGVVRGFYAIVSFGSEIGTDGRTSHDEGSVRNVTVTNVSADRCNTLAFFKPGALIYDWRNGLVDGVRLENLRLEDLGGDRFTTGVRMTAARGAVIRNVIGRGLSVRARAASQGVMPTAAIDLTIFDEGDAARIENVDLQMSFEDPHNGASHGSKVPGFPVDHIVRIEKINARKGSMSGISLDVSGRGSRFGGVMIGGGLDDAITLRRALLYRVGLNPPASLGGGGIWSDSRVRLGEISVDSPVLPKFGGSALGPGGSRR